MTSWGVFDMLNCFVSNSERQGNLTCMVWKYRTSRSLKITILKCWFPMRWASLR